MYTLMFFSAWYQLFCMIQNFPLFFPDVVLSQIVSFTTVDLEM